MMDRIIAADETRVMYKDVIDVVFLWYTVIQNKKKYTKSLTPLKCGNKMELASLILYYANFVSRLDYIQNRIFRNLWLTSAAFLV